MWLRDGVGCKRGYEPGAGGRAQRARCTKGKGLLTALSPPTLMALAISSSSNVKLLPLASLRRAPSTRPTLAPAIG